MKDFYKLCSISFLCAALCLFISFNSSAQVQTARSISTGPNSNGFYEYLPAGYDPNGSKNYPLMVFCHGSGEVGNGTTDLPLVLRNGPPKLINQGTFPQSFTVNGSTFSFIVLSPQFIGWPFAPDVDAIVNYAVAHYHVDQTRIYVTGLSMGGGATWDYASYNSITANKVAAVVPVSGAEALQTFQAQVIASNNLPVYATHNLNDPTVASSTTIDNIALINGSSPPPNPAAVDTIFPVSGHDSWTTTYDPAFLNPRIGNLNVYQWMLQFRRLGVILPVTLTDYKAFLSDDRSSVTIDWTTANEENNKYFILQRSADGQNFTDLDTVAASNQPGGHAYTDVDHAPLTGNDFYRLSQVDLNGKTTLFSVLEVTVPAARAGTTAFRVSPNPARNSIYLELVHPELGPLLVSIYDATGRTLRTWKFDKQQPEWDQTLDISGIPAGNYFVQVKGTTIKEVKQFIKE